MSWDEKSINKKMTDKPYLFVIVDFINNKILNNISSFIYDNELIFENADSPIFIMIYHYITLGGVNQDSG